MSARMPYQHQQQQQHDAAVSHTAYYLTPRALQTCEDHRSGVKRIRDPVAYVNHREVTVGPAGTDVVKYTNRAELGEVRSLQTLVPEIHQKYACKKDVRTRSQAIRNELAQLDALRYDGYPDANFIKTRQILKEQYPQWKPPVRDPRSAPPEPGSFQARFAASSVGQGARTFYQTATAKAPRIVGPDALHTFGAR